jgi:hypothetical protein
MKTEDLDITMTPMRAGRNDLFRSDVDPLEETMMTEKRKASRNINTALSNSRFD